MFLSILLPPAYAYDFFFLRIEPKLNGSGKMFQTFLILLLLLAKIKQKRNQLGGVHHQNVLRCMAWSKKISVFLFEKKSCYVGSFARFGARHSKAELTNIFFPSRPCNKSKCSSNLKEREREATVIAKVSKEVVLISRFEFVLITNSNGCSGLIPLTGKKGPQFLMCEL